MMVIMTLSMMTIDNHDADNVGLDVDDYDGDTDGPDVDDDHDSDDNNGLDEDDNHNGDTGRALVETEPVRYQLEEIQLTLDKEDSEKVIILMIVTKLE